MEQNHISSARNTFSKATDSIPLSVELWRSFLVFEEEHGDEKSVSRVVEGAHSKGISLITSK